MEFRQLEYLVAVADEASFTRAAERVNVTQPGISSQIKQLEKELGQRLFERGKGPVTPTEAGVELLAHARAVLARVDHARESLDALAGLVRGRVAVGTVRGAPLGRMARMLGAFHSAYPGVTISLREDESDVLVDHLRSGALDLALVGIGGSDTPDGITSVVLVEDRVTLQVGPAHRWRDRTEVALAELHGTEALVALPQGTGIRAAFDAACAERGVEPRIAFEVSALSTAAELARENLGAALMPESAPAPLTRGLRCVLLEAPVVRSRLALAWSDTDPGTWRPAARALVEAATR